MKKYLVLLLLCIAIDYSNQYQSLKFLEENERFDIYPIELFKGILDSFKLEGELNFPKIRECLDNDLDLKKTFDTLYSQICNFRGKEITLDNFFLILVEFGQLLMKIKSKHNVCLISTNSEINYLIQELEDFLMNFPPNFKIYYQNFKSNQMDIVFLLKNIRNNLYNPYKLGSLLGELFKILVKNANYKDSGLESFDEFQLFNNCYSNIIAGMSTDLKSFNDIIKTIFRQEKIDDLLYSMSNMLSVMSDRIRYCSKYMNHLIYK